MNSAGAAEPVRSRLALVTAKILLDVVADGPPSTAEERAAAAEQLLVAPKPCEAVILKSVLGDNVVTIREGKRRGPNLILELAEFERVVLELPSDQIVMSREEFAEWTTQYELPDLDLTGRSEIDPDELTLILECSRLGPRDRGDWMGTIFEG